METDKGSVGLVMSPPQAFREDVCSECMDYKGNKGLCAGDVDSILKCITIFRFDDEVGFSSDNPAGDICKPGDC